MRLSCVIVCEVNAQLSIFFYFICRLCEHNFFHGFSFRLFYDAIFTAKNCFLMRFIFYPCEGYFAIRKIRVAFRIFRNFVQVKVRLLFFILFQCPIYKIIKFSLNGMVVRDTYIGKAFSYSHSLSSHYILNPFSAISAILTVSFNKINVL